MNDQKDHWNIVHDQGGVDHVSNKLTGFAEEVLQIIPASSSILELGCGSGSDSVGFAQRGHRTVATDFSEVAIEKCQQRYRDVSSLEFKVLDISQPINFSNSSFEVLYARLSLHYFKDSVTRNIISEIHRVLRPGGYLCFICKSVTDPLYGLGTKIEDDMFEHNGHIRHFFSEEYAKSLLEEKFDNIRINSGNEKFYDRQSAYIKAIATAVK